MSDEDTQIHTVTIEPHKVGLQLRGITSLAIECFASNVTLNPDSSALVYTFAKKEDGKAFIELLTLHRIKAKRKSSK
jgi:hypothetical protein